MEKIIEVNNVTMEYTMANDRINSLKEFVIKFLKRKLKFKKFTALKDVTFDVKKGEVVGLIGHNGAGKSTMLKIISGILTPSKGSIKVNGNVVPMLELGAGFDPDMSGKENIYLNGSILGYSKSFLNEKYDDIVEFAELEEFINEPIRNYSSGMVARLAFSIASAVNPEILIVDEILSVGDINFQQKSLNRMKEMMGGGTTVLLVNHNIDVVIEMCNRVVWIEKGQVQKVGDAKQVCEEFLEKSNIKVEQKS